MKKTSFTLVELIVAIVILGITVTFGIPVYQNIIESSKAKICETNLKALKTALDIYALEHDQLPAVLSQIPRKDIQEAYRRVLEGRDGWKIELAYFIAGWRENGVAYGGIDGQDDNEPFIKSELAKNNSSMIICPSDRYASQRGSLSYGINALLQGMTYAQYKALPANTPIIVDCDSSIFTGENYANRHKRYLYHGTYARYYFQGVTMGGTGFNSLDGVQEYFYTPVPSDPPSAFTPG